MDADARVKGHRLVAAAAKGETEALKAALEDGADVHFEQDLPLRSAAFTGQIECLKMLVVAGADVSAQFHEALFVAAKAGDREMVDYLLDQGGDPVIVMKFHDKKLDATSRDLLTGRSLRDSFEKAKQDQDLIANLAEEAQRNGLKFNRRPPAP